MGAVEPLRLAAVSSHPRHDLISRITGVLTESGWVLDARSYSNLALAIHFELSRRQLPGMTARLAALPMAWSDPGLAALSRLEGIPPPDLPETIPGSLHITFRHLEPDRPSEVPAVPG